MNLYPSTHCLAPLSHFGRVRRARFALAAFAIGVCVLLGVLSGEAAAAQPAAGSSVGEVMVVVGKVKMQQSGKTRLLKSGDQLSENARLETESNGYLYVRLVDRGFISLRPNSAMTIEAYAYDPDQPGNSKIKLTLHKGVMRSVSGVGAQNSKDKFRLNTPVAAIGIRGTDFSTFTDDKTTLISVRSGGIVASPFSDACMPSGVGPCEGARALDLNAGQPNALLQIKQGELKPLLLDGTKPNLMPDKIAPPLPDENTRSQLSAKEPGAGLSAQLIEMTVAAGLSNASPIEPKISWGRWQHFADMSPVASLEQFQQRFGGDNFFILRPFAMGRTIDPDFVLPTAGKFEFALKNYEAYIADYTNYKSSVAVIENAKLSVDFARSTFSTSLDVKAGSRLVQVDAVGSVIGNGALEGNLAASNTLLQGFLAGPGATQAGYAFSTPTDTNGLSAAGATFWAR